MRAHRFSWELAHGPIPDGLCVLHRCDNPPCVRPDHLFLGTNLDNIADCTAKGRKLKGARHHKAKLSDCEVRGIRKLYFKGARIVDLAHLVGVHPRTVSLIIRGKIWRHLS